MASIPSQFEAAHSSVATASEKLLVVLTSVSQESLQASLGILSEAFPSEAIMVAAPDLSAQMTDDLATGYPNIEMRTEAPAAAPSGSWVLGAADFVNLYKLAQQSSAGACLMLGPDSATLNPDAIRALALELSKGSDLAVPRYTTGPREGLVNSALLYPVSRAIFGARPRFPLAVDLGLSNRMAARLAAVAQKFTATNQNDALIWPVAEAAASGYSIAEVEAGTRVQPKPQATDLNALLAQIGSSLFTEVDTYAAFWQRARVNPVAVPGGRHGELPADSLPDIQPMLDAFRLAYTNLHEIWSLVLPPNSLLGLKRLSQMAPDNFRMADSLWARIVYDFILAYRLRTINRGHLLGALTPLYLAWVASHILLSQGGVDPEVHVEQVVQAFELDKAYLVSRWRWPDRFNP